jgi:hypothetical protein
MLETLLRIGKWHRRTKQQNIPDTEEEETVSDDGSERSSFGDGEAEARLMGGQVLCDLRAKLIQLERVLPFGVGPLLRVLL